MLTPEQKTMLSNITRMIEISKENKKENKEALLLKDFLVKNFNASEENILKITKILDIKEKIEFKISKETSEFFMLKGFLLKLEELNFKFPYKKNKVVMFDFDENLNIDYLLEEIKSILKKDEKEVELNLIKEQIKVHGNNYENISIATGIDKEKVEKILQKIARGEKMRESNPKVKKADDQF